MQINYPQRSKFLGTIEDAIRQHRTEFDAGRVVPVKLEVGGYDGQVVVTIHPENRVSFETAWRESPDDHLKPPPDSTRFPARIKAAAFALLNSGFAGKFEISHDDGSLEIRRL